MLAKVFKSGNSQAVRLPKAMRFDVSEVDITKVIIEILIWR
jgi:virulence-associated protein VagC